MPLRNSAPCPFCQTPLLSPNDRNIVLVKLLAEKEEILRKEAIFRKQEEDQMQQLKVIADGGGEFPTLAKGGSGTSTPHERPPPTPEPPTTRKVLSISGKGGGTTLTKFAPKASTPPVARPKPPPSKVPSKEEIEKLKPVPCPPTEVPFVKDVPVDEERPWKDLRGGGLVYVPPEPEPAPVEEAPQHAESSKGKKKGKGKKGRPDGPTVPGAAPP
ncbi:hypothetical protein FRC01_003930 [Tulasnella sp. 417]|nr:hypothetical protein FRC01_003930 [Tulasnella sp. 417]